MQKQLLERRLKHHLFEGCLGAVWRVILASHALPKIQCTHSSSHMRTVNTGTPLTQPAPNSGRLSFLKGKTRGKHLALYPYVFVIHTTQARACCAARHVHRGVARSTRCFLLRFMTPWAPSCIKLDSKMALLLAFPEIQYRLF